MKVVQNGNMENAINTQPGWVYLMWCKGTMRWKIGYSRNVKTRWEALSCASPFPLIVAAAKPGRMADEQDLHIEFRQYRTHREWFDLPESAVWKLLERFGISFDEAYAIANLV